MARGQIPDQTSLDLLEKWSSPARAALRIIDSHLYCEHDADSEDSLFIPKEDEEYVRSLPELDQENIDLERCAKIQQRKQDSLLAATL